MIGGLTGRPLSNSTGPGHADPDPAHVVAGTADLARAARRSGRPPIRAPPPGRGRCRGRTLARRAACRARSLTATRAWVAPRSATRTTPGVAVEREHRRRAPAGGGAAARLVDEAVAEQRVDALGDGRAGESGLPRQVGARDRHAVADQAEQRPGAARGGGASRRARLHASQSYSNETAKASRVSDE